MRIQGLVVATTLALCGHTHSQEHHHHHHGSHSESAAAPIGVMGSHVHEAGHWMVSYRFMSMNMSGNLQGSESISTEAIATTVANPFVAMEGMPPTLRVVPTEMTTDMHMLGVMYAPTDKVTLMAMLNYVKKDMTHTTYQGGMGNTVLGNFRTQSSGMGDTKVSALVSLYNSEKHKLHLNAGVSIPTGSIDEEAEVLTPMNMRPTIRMPYAMQLGSGTYDLLPGVTYNGNSNDLSWGAQAMMTLRLGENDESYTLGDKQQLQAWAAYSVSPKVSFSVRGLYESSDAIEGQDPLIMAPVQTANPDNYGGDRLDLALGSNVELNGGHRVALEYQTTLDQDVNGVQMEMDDMLTVGYQYAF